MSVKQKVRNKLRCVASMVLVLAMVFTLFPGYVSAEEGEKADSEAAVMAAQGVESGEEAEAEPERGAEAEAEPEGGAESGEEAEAEPEGGAESGEEAEAEPEEGAEPGDDVGLGEEAAAGTEGDVEAKETVNPEGAGSDAVGEAVESKEDTGAEAEAGISPAAEGDVEPVVTVEHLATIARGAKVDSYVIGDPTPNYNNNASIGNIRAIEEQSCNRLIDGSLATGVKADSGWVGKLWDDSTGVRSLYLNLYRGDNRDITIDLGQERHITEAALHIAVSTGYGINPLGEVTFYLSQDGISYYRVGQVNSEQATADEKDLADLPADEPSHMYYRAEGLDYNARYIRVKFEVAVWTFVDELIVNGDEHISADAQPFDPDTLLEDEVSRETYASLSQSGGIAHDYLAYQGWGTVNGALEETYKTVDEYKAVIAYVDGNGKAVDWLYDGVTVLGHSSTKDDGAYIYVAGKTPANKNDWQQWLDHVFHYTHEGEVVNMDALDQAAAKAKAEMVEAGILTQAEADEYVIPVKLAVYPALYNQAGWGSVSQKVAVTKAEDGSLSFEISDQTTSCDFTLAGNGQDVNAALSARASAYYWYMKLAEEMFSEKNYKNISLNGYYYYNELADTTNDPLVEDSIKLYNMLVDYIAAEKNYEKLYSYWIPYYTAEGYKKWESYGFDYAVMQPNAYGYGQDRLNMAADFAYFYGLGIEMEWMGSNINGYKETFLKYLETAKTKGYRDGVQAWYWGTWSLPQMAYKTGAEAANRDIYDKVYEYISGNMLHEGNLLEAAGLSVKFRQVPSDSAALDKVKGMLSCLTDGISDGADWGSNVVQINNNSTATPVDVIAKLARTSAVTSLSMDFFDWESAGVYMPSLVQYFVSEDGERWRMAGASGRTDGYEWNNEDGVVANYVMARVFSYAEEGVLKAWLGITEFTATGKPSAEMPQIPEIAPEDNLLAKLGNVEIAIEDSEGTEVPSSNDNDALTILTDGRHGGAWNGDYYCWFKQDLADPFSVVIDLGEKCYVDSLGASFFEWVGAGVGIPEAVSFYYSSDGNAWNFAGDVADYVAVVGGTSDSVNVDFIHTLENFVLTRYIRIDFERSLDLYRQVNRNNWVALGEVMVSGMTAREMWLEELAELVERADEITAGDDYVNASWQRFTAALKKAKDLLNASEPDAAELETVLLELQEAIEALKIKADKEALERSVQDAEAIDLSGYTKESAEALKKALAEAKVLLADENLSEDDQAKVNRAVTRLDEAIRNLQKVTTEPTAGPGTEPTADPSAEPTADPSAEPTAEPSTEPTAEPTGKPDEPVYDGWSLEEDGNRYWYEDGVKQGTEGRGREIYDPDSDAWYWLDAVDGGKAAANKDVYLESAGGNLSENINGTGKWVRYDEKGHMVKGWDTTEVGTYYFDMTYGTMAKGYVELEGTLYYFDRITGIGTGEPCRWEAAYGWVNREDGSRCWYEDGVKQGTEGRGREIYDPVSDAWYWLDAADGGRIAVSRDVYMESAAGDWAENADGTGKWVRYDENGQMVKGWHTTEVGTCYFDLIYGTMAKGVVTIDEKEYRFDATTGILTGKQESRATGRKNGAAVITR